MTSIERDDSNIYMDTKEPKYNILTYSWGRWQAEQGSSIPSLPVRGTTWEIPTVKEEHFSVEAFQRVIDQMGEDGVEWGWIDIACIDQENIEIRMREIGRQASIFRNAHNVFVWLSHSKPDVLKVVLKDIYEYSPGLHHRSNSRFTIPEIVDHLYKAFQIIFNDP